MYLESDRKLREMLTSKNEPNLSSLMPFIKDDYVDAAGASQKAHTDEIAGDGNRDGPKWLCNKCPASYRTRQDLRLHKRNHRKKIGSDEYVKMEPTDNGQWMQAMPAAPSASKPVGVKEMPSYQPEVILSIAEDNKKMIMKVRPQPKVWRCNKCLIDFPTRRQLREHRRSHRDVPAPIVKSEPSGSMAAPVVAIEFNKASYMSQTTSGNQARNPSSRPTVVKLERKWICHECRESFTTRQFLRKHKQMHRMSKTGNVALSPQKRAPTEEKKWICNLCHSIFTTRDLLRKHKQENHQARPKPPLQSNGNVATAGFVCEYCGKQFVSNELKLQHMEVHSVGVNSIEQKYYCNACGIWLASSHNLSEHNRVVHQQRNDEKQYKYQHQLKTHMNRPDNGRPYVYPNNGPKTFYDRSNGRDHMKPMHINEQ